MKLLETIGLGGGCHWCTEAVFQVINGVELVEQGYISSYAPHTGPSEAVIVHFDPTVVHLAKLIRMHLQTHSSTSAHSMRSKYRSAIYTFSDVQAREANDILNALRKEHSAEIITQILPFGQFHPSADQFRNYFVRDPGKPFCKTHIVPKLEFLKEEYPEDLKKK